MEVGARAVPGRHSGAKRVRGRSALRAAEPAPRKARRRFDALALRPPRGPWGEGAAAAAAVERGTGGDRIRETALPDHRDLRRALPRGGVRPRQALALLP